MCAPRLSKTKTAVHELFTSRFCSLFVWVEGWHPSFRNIKFCQQLCHLYYVAYFLCIKRNTKNKKIKKGGSVLPAPTHPYFCPAPIGAKFQTPNLSHTFLTDGVVLGFWNFAHSFKLQEIQFIICKCLILSLLLGNDKYFLSATFTQLWLDLLDFLRVMLFNPSLCPAARNFTLFALKCLPTRFTMQSIY